MTKNTPTIKLYWHLLTLISKSMTQSTRVKFTKDELHLVFKYAFKVNSIKSLSQNQWGEYFAFIITGALTVLDVPCHVVLPKDTGGIQWSNINQEEHATTS